jgi:hypothetical protein
MAVATASDMQACLAGQALQLSTEGLHRNTHPPREAETSGFFASFLFFSSAFLIIKVCAHLKSFTSHA